MQPHLQGGLLFFLLWILVCAKIPISSSFFVGYSASSQLIFVRALHMSRKEPQLATVLEKKQTVIIDFSFFCL